MATTATSFSVTAFLLHLPLTTATTTTNNKLTFTSPVFSSTVRRRNLGLVCCCSTHAAISRKNQGAVDPELRSVLELATDPELYELERILFGPSYFSPLLKSLVSSKADVDYAMIGEDIEERDEFIAALESRFLFLAADARSTIRGWRPMYRDVLLANYSSEESGIFPGLWENSEASDVQGSVELGLDQWKVPALAASRVGAAELRSILLKGGGMFTLAKIYQFLARRLSGKVFLEAANYQMKKEALEKGGQLAAVNLESMVALLAARQGFAGAASRFLGFRSMMTLLGPMMWGTFLADVVIQMIGTDYARILRAIYAFAQIRITRTYRSPLDNERDHFQLVD